MAVGEHGQKARRWGRPDRVVERTHSWLNRFRYLLTRWAKKPENYLARLYFACARITWYNLKISFNQPQQVLRNTGPGLLQIEGEHPHGVAAEGVAHINRGPGGGIE